MAEEIAHAALVIGAGPAGLATALALDRLGIETGLIGPPANTTDARTAALFQGSIRFLENIGAWDAIRHAAEPITAIRIADATGALLRAPEVLFQSREVGAEAFGYNIPTGALVAALEQCAEERLTRILSSGVTRLEPAAGMVRVHTAEGRSFTAKLAAAADGRNSIGREAAGIATKSWSYPQAALVATFAHTRAHGGASTELHRRSGPLTLVPMAGDASSLVWVEAPEEARRLAALDDTRFLAALETHLGGLLGTLSQVSPRKVFPLSGQTAEVLAKNRIALIGEAGHVIPPIGAQGLNLSFRDAATLAEVATDAAAQGGDIGADGALAAYNRRRHADVTARVWSIDLMNRSLLSEFAPVSILRGTGIATLRLVAPLRRFVMREGMTPSFATPRLMSPQSTGQGLDGSPPTPHQDPHS